MNKNLYKSRKFCPKKCHLLAITSTSKKTSWMVSTEFVLQECNYNIVCDLQISVSPSLRFLIMNVFTFILTMTTLQVV